MLIELMSSSEKRVLGRSAIGEASKEIADQLCLTENTVNTHLNNIKVKVKEKTGKGYKLAELRFLFLCEVIGERSEEIKKIIAAATCALLLLTYGTSFDNSENRRRSRIRRREQTESISVFEDQI